MSTPANPAALLDPQNVEGTPAAPPPKEDGTKRLEQALEQQGRELQGLKAALTSRQPAAQPPAGQPKTKEDLTKDFWKDPLEMSAAIAQSAVAQFAQTQGAQDYDLKKAMARDKARQGREKLFDRYAPEIEALVAQSHPQFHTNLNVWQHAVSSVVGSHVEEIAAEMAKEQNVNKEQPNGAPALRGGDGPAAPSLRSPQAPAKDKLSDDERYIAGKMGISEDAYRHGKSLLNRRNDFISESHPEAFDEVVTYDSDVARSRREKARASK